MDNRNETKEHGWDYLEYSNLSVMGKFWTILVENLFLFYFWHKLKNQLQDKKQNTTTLGD